MSLLHQSMRNWWIHVHVKQVELHQRTTHNQATERKVDKNLFNKITSLQWIQLSDYGSAGLQFYNMSRFYLWIGFSCIQIQIFYFYFCPGLVLDVQSDVTNHHFWSVHNSSCSVGDRTTQSTLTHFARTQIKHMVW